MTSMPFKSLFQAKEREEKDDHNTQTATPFGRKLGRTAMEAAALTLGVAKESADWNPILKGVLGGANAVVDLCRQFQANRDSWDELALYISQIHSLLETHMPNGNQSPSHVLMTNINQLASVLEEIRQDIVTMQKRAGLTKIFNTKKDPVIIAGFRQKLADAFTGFTAVELINIHRSIGILDAAAPSQSFINFDTTLLPVPAHFYGRDEFVQSSIALVDEGLVKNQSVNLPIMGPGGIGKTTAALAVMHHSRIKEHFGSQIFFVSCEAINSAISLASAIMKAFSFPVSEGDATKAFLNALNIHTSPAIICLDNFETPWDSADRKTISSILELLANHNSISIILTMRGTEKPASHRIQWKPLPELGTLSVDASVLAFSEISNSSPVEGLPTLVELVDCVPLAISLLAQRYSISKEPIPRLIRLWKEQKIRSNSTGKDDNMDVSVKLSLDSKKMLDSPNALRLLTILSHLPNGAAGDDLPFMVLIDDGELAEAVITLQSTSLAFIDISGQLRTLSPIRLYILHHQTMLQEDVLRLMQYVFGLTDKWKAAVGTPEYVYTKQHLDSEWGNVSSLLLEWLHHTSGNEEVLKSILSATHAMEFHIPDALLLQEAVKVAAPETLAHSRCLQRLGDILHRQNRYSEAQEKLEGAMAEFKRIGNDVEAAQCMQRLGDILRMQNRYFEAQEKQEEAMAEFKRIGDNLGAAQCMQRLGNILRMQSRYFEAQEKLEGALSEFKRIGDNLGAAQCMRSLGNILQMQDRYLEAQEKLEGAMADFKRIGGSQGTAQCMQRLGDIFQMQGRYSEAWEKLEGAMTEFKRIGDNLGTAQCMQRLGDILWMQGRYSEAQEKLEEAMAEFKRIGNSLGAAQCKQSLGDILRMQGRYFEAQGKLEEAMIEFKRIGDNLGAAQCMRSLGNILQMQDRYSEAQEKLEGAMAEFRRIGDNLRVAQCMQSLDNIIQIVKTH